MAEGFLQVKDLFYELPRFVTESCGGTLSMFLGWRTHIKVPPQLHPKAGFVNPETPLDVRLGTTVFQKWIPIWNARGMRLWGFRYQNFRRPLMLQTFSCDFVSLFPREYMFTWYMYQNVCFLVLICMYWNTHIETESAFVSLHSASTIYKFQHLPTFSV